MKTMLLLVALYCLCVRIRPFSADMVPVKGSDIQTPDELNATRDPPIASVETHSKNISIQSSALSSADMSKLISIHLGMSLDSVDDMYYGCSHKMLIKVKRYYLPRSTREGLHSSYTKLCANKAMKGKDRYDPLSWNHFRALCTYTAGAYDDLNRAVRKDKTSYKTSFQFHALHFLLSDAIRLLKLNQRGCYTVYRRSRLLFIGEPGLVMRFGSFASSSLNKHLHQFGQRTCFEIDTCFGAYLKSYSEFDSDEDEVLIPPYEMFTIISVDKSGENHLDCDVFYKLETAGVYSGLNCQAVDLQSRPGQMH